MMVYVVNQVSKNCLIDITTADCLMAFKRESDAKKFKIEREHFLEEQYDFVHCGAGIFKRYNRYAEEQQKVYLEIERVCLA